MDDDYRIPSGTSIGHVHLKVSDLDRAVRFYREVIGLDMILSAARGEADEERVAGWAVLGRDFDQGPCDVSGHG